MWMQEWSDTALFYVIYRAISKASLECGVVLAYLKGVQHYSELLNQELSDWQNVKKNFEELFMYSRYY